MSKRQETPKITPPDVMSELTSLQAAKPTETPKTADKQRKADKATYYIGPELKERIKRISIDWGVPASQVARFFLQHAVDVFERGEMPEPNLKTSDSPAYRHNIDFG